MAQEKAKVATNAPPKAAKSNKKAAPAFVKYYLFAYNVLSTIGWAYILILTLIHVLDLDGKSSSIASTSPTASFTLGRLFSSIPFLKTAQKINTVGGLEARLHPLLVPFYRRAATTFGRVGVTTAWVQSCALLEVVHVALGWVRSPLQTTAMQVSSRLFLVWGIVEQFASVRSNPLYTSMVFAWSLTEVIRYSFYACNLGGYEPYLLLYLRYTTFYVLYPLGASSEAFLIYATLPSTSPIPSWSSWIMGMWKPSDYIRATLFLIWWPGLYIMYTHMIKQRRKTLGSGRTLAAKKTD
ncbi:PTPLA-domain-containing protein [Lentinula raphanica]|uniref:Very-long-chain (3R)-3-hydroxyacyl-CoA dehydratase n=1 Tax=Lentinula raphanica TaxID=153919 RepID=A0AA38PKF6_9AGAR|nr:PTPLA-domain-containing protein [Lentinula raphanica]KAJ3844131.1 PTPLA-domain-containing protein [Lentinula raphanica]